MAGTRQAWLIFQYPKLNSQPCIRDLTQRCKGAKTARDIHSLTNDHLLAAWTLCVKILFASPRLCAFTLRFRVFTAWSSGQ